VQIDLATEFGERVTRRLINERIVWLTTVSSSGIPYPSPVWFLLQDDTVLVYSEPNTTKLRNIARNPNVALSFNSTVDGGDVVIITGIAAIEPDAVLADAVPEYLEKYKAGIASLGMTDHQFATTYFTAVRVTPLKLRGF
jgi:PPOX class probable F420-dependent enzyme